MSNRDFLFLSIITFITVLLWTILESYHIYKTSMVPKSLQMQIVQITPTLNRQVVENLESRVDENLLPTISPSKIKTATSSAN